MDSDPELPWNIIEKYFRDDEHVLVRHHLDSYNDFFGQGIYRIFKEKNPIVLQKEQDEKTNEFKLRCELYLGGKSGDRVYYGKPIIYDDNREHYMYPNEARLRNMTYGITIHYDVEVVFKIYDEAEGAVKETTAVLNKLLLGRFPIMLQSNLCILQGMEPKARFYMGECKNDFGGYFIIDGKEKVIVSQEKFADNMLYIREYDAESENMYSHVADVRQVSEDSSKPVSTLSVRMVAPDNKFSNKHIVVNILNVRSPIPLFILMRALGVISDRDIIETCLLDLEENSELVDLFIPSVHDASHIFTQEGALKYIANLTKSATVVQVHDILVNYFLPQVGETNYIQKAYYLGRMVYKMLLVVAKIEPPTDRDSFLFKRIELSGSLIYDLFREYYTLQLQHIRLEMDREYTLKPGVYDNNFVSLIELNYQDFFRERIVEQGFRKAFKGNWGAHEHTKRIGVIQDLNRLSYNSALSHLRKINLPMDSSAKIVKPRLLHGSQWGMIDIVDSPDGANIGFHKHLTMTARVTSHCSAYPMMKWLRDVLKMRLLEECTNMYLHYTTKVYVNGTWVGALTRPEEAMRVFKVHRRNGLIPIYSSVRWNIRTNEIHIYTDAGRLCRPLFYVDEDTHKASYDNDGIIDLIRNKKFSWNELITGFTAKSGDAGFKPFHCKYYTVEELYGKTTENKTTEFKRLKSTMAILEYLDTSETEGALISMTHKLPAMDADSVGAKKYTHVEIHPSLCLGVMGNQIAFPENNPLPRNVFGCGQAKQAASVYHSNYPVRIDKMGIVINNGEIPLVKSRYLDLINHEQHPCGFNAIVAIMSYNGYNVEDSILFNEASVKRGMFRITYYSMYEEREESTRNKGVDVDKRFANVMAEGVSGIKSGHDYSHLNKHGLIAENTELDDKTVVIGMGIVSANNPDGQMRDASVFPKKGQLGFVDKAFMTDGEEGFRLAKVRVREERFPSIGDKFCSRCGQKGTCGLIIPEQDMPFTADGIRPDIIINPHAIPSRMTIGQLIESIMGKACVMHGGFGECTAFMTNGPKQDTYGDVLRDYGFHSSGCQVLYNGMTGEEVKSDIFIGPTYYMRLKQMVKDKINYRAQGPRTQLTRQTVQGRANDGGLRIGEMERDGILAHGAMHFLNESMMIRGDEYYMAVCNKSGMIAVYNEYQDLFMSPAVDGPIKFSGEVSETMTVNKVTRFGRSFSIVRIPYSFKLLMQELQVMNVQMRIITEDNIDQLPSMSYSNNIYKLLHDDMASMSVEDLIQENKKAAGIKEPISEFQRDKRIQEQEQEQEIKGELAVTESESVEKINPALRQEMEALGWEFAVMDKTTGKRKYWRDPNKEADQMMLVSLILNKNGEPTEEWAIEGKEWDGTYPKRFPEGWASSMLMYYDKVPISPQVMIEQLKKHRVPSNWIVALGYIVANNYGKPGTGNESNETVKLKELETARNALDRAKRDGDVEQEEIAKTQVDRLTAELDEIRAKRMRTGVSEATVSEATISEATISEASNVSNVSTPEYTSAFTPPSAQEIQSRMNAYNQNMSKYYSEHPELKPDEYTTTPLTPEYTSAFTPSPQQPPQQQQPQQQPPQQQPPQQQGGGLNLQNMLAPMMNVPLIATMPMTTLIGGQQSQQPQQTQHSQQSQQKQPHPPSPKPKTTESSNGTRSITIT
jgi:DNA-directed RNA polymerase II subunit RPB2